MRRFYAYAAVVSVTLVVSGCSLFGGGDRNETEGWAAERTFDRAKQRMRSSDFEGAIRYFQFLEERFPFTAHAQQAQLEMAYCYYKLREPEPAKASLRRFQKLYPTHEHMDYSYYLLGVINFNAGRGLSDRFVFRDPSQRDQTPALQSFQDFSELIQRYPDSEYSEDARRRMTHLRNILAQHEVNVANFYMRRGAFVAAATRARTVIENYQQAPSMPDALVILAKAYKVLEMDALADDAMRVLALNYPTHPGVRQVQRVTVR